MTDLICRYCSEKGYPFRKDAAGNVYVTKGEAMFYPCVIAHLDTFFRTVPARLELQEGRLLGYDAQGHRCGVGGDNKAGVWICLRLLESLPVLKAAFFVGEETSCWGSEQLDSTFFHDVGYGIGFDCPTGKIFGYRANGRRLFENQGRFIQTAWPIMCRRGYSKMHSHPLTDIYWLREKFSFQCLSLGSGYYNLHDWTEFIQIREMEGARQAGEEIIRALGNAHYPFTTEAGEPPIPESPFSPLDFMEASTLDSLMEANVRLAKDSGSPTAADMGQWIKANPGRAHIKVLQYQTQEHERALAA